MTSLRRIVGGAIALSITAWFGWYAWRALPAADLDVLADPTAWAGVVVAALLYAMIIPVSGWAWSRLLAAKGERRTPTSLAILMGRTQLAKYVPGNVAQHALRMALAIRAGVPVQAHVGSVLQETVLAITASLVVGGLCLALDARAWAVVSQVGLQGQGPAIVVAILVAGVVATQLPRFASRWPILAALQMPTPRVAMLPFLAYITNYLLVGAGLAVLARAMDAPPSLGFLAATGAFALSWVLGFLAPGAPAGLGVREGLMVALLAGTAHSEEVLVFVVLARVATLAGDALAFVVGWSYAGPIREQTG